MAKPEESSAAGWRLFDRIIADASADGYSNPWTADENQTSPRFTPDYPTLSRLLGVPTQLDAKSQSGILARAVDVWVAYEFRRAGFAPDSIWPRDTPPRVLPAPIAHLIRSPTPAKYSKAKSERREAAIQAVRDLIEEGDLFGGAVGSSAKILGKNYDKQVDVGMSSWETGPELLVSTKRMDSSLAKNAANRVEESYGDAKNLRLRHPRAALGFVYLLNSAEIDAYETKAAWLLDLLAKLGQEDDAYDGVLLLVPDYAISADSEVDEKDILDDGSVSDVDIDTEIELAAMPHLSVDQIPSIPLNHARVPADLTADRFFERMCRLVLDRTPLKRHPEARARLAQPGA